MLVLQGLYAQFEVLNDLESIKGPLKKQLADMVQRLAEAEFGLDADNRAIKMKEAVKERLIESKKEVEEARNSLKVELDVVRAENEIELKMLHERIESLTEKNGLLKTGEGVDLEAFIDSIYFAPIKDPIEDSTGEELIDRIKEVTQTRPLILDEGCGQLIGS